MMGSSLRLILALAVTLFANAALSATLISPANDAVVATGVNTFSWSLEAGDTTNFGLRVMIYSDATGNNQALDACWSGSPANGGITFNSAMELCLIDLTSLDGVYYWRVEKSAGGSWVDITGSLYTLNIGTPPPSAAPATPVPALPLFGLLALGGLLGLFSLRKLKK